MADQHRSRSALAGLHDAELATLATGGGGDAFGELARRHGAAVRGLLRRMGADAALADDLAQDAFLAAFERIAEFRGEGAFAGWIKKIAARLYLKRWRKRARLDPIEGPGPDMTEDGGGEGAALQRLDLDDALGRLSPAERMCVSLCYGAGFSHPEIGEMLELPMGTVKSHVRRGLDKLKRRLVPADGPFNQTGRATLG